MAKNIMKITTLYGSETGTAQDVAEQIWKSAKRFCYCPSSIAHVYRNIRMSLYIWKA